MVYTFKEGDIYLNSCNEKYVIQNNLIGKPEGYLGMRLFKKTEEHLQNRCRRIIL